MTGSRAVLAFALLVPGWLAAQEPSLEGRLDPATRAEVLAIVDSARADGIPTRPLLNKALEGAGRGAESERILWAVRGLAVRLETARDVLGYQSTEPELVAGAGALYAGVPPASLAELREAVPGASVALPLVVLADMVDRGVPTDTATTVLVSLARAGVDHAAYDALRLSVAQDIRAGAAPAAAAYTRARGLLLEAGRIPQQRPPP